jgi:anaerobic magnesium-protoporphyrin IX monomethyl ester cyclase
LGKKVRFYPPERIIEELKILKYEKGAKGVYFLDSTFTINKKYVMKLCDLMVKAKLDLKWTCGTRADRVDDELCAAMHAAGCRMIMLGIESANQQSLDLIKKQCTVEQQIAGVKIIHKHKISTICCYILCLPNETSEMSWKTVELAKKIASRIALFYLPVPYPGSELYKACKESGGITEADSWSHFLSIDFKNPIYINPLIGKERMQEIYKAAYKEYYKTPAVWLSNFRSLFWGVSPDATKKGLKALLSLIGVRKQ